MSPAREIAQLGAPSRGTVVAIGMRMRIRIVRIVAMAVGAAALVACGGAVVGGDDDILPDSGTDSGQDGSPPGTCNGAPCSAYCIHPTSQTCATCTQAQNGDCPPGSTLETDCPAGPAMPPGQYCVTYPPADPPYCSQTIPIDCWDPSPPTSSGDVMCGPEVCGA